MQKTVAIIGAGVIGAGWAARFALHGWQVRIFDPSPEAEDKFAETLDLARQALGKLYDIALPDQTHIAFYKTISETVKNACWIQENVPEVLEIKHKIYAEIQQHCLDNAVIASSTSGFTPSQLREKSTHPEQIIVAHPFNPVYLLPLVEVVGLHNNTYLSNEITQIIENIGMYPLLVRKEIDAHIADRFLEAVWREALWLVKDGIATTEEIDEAIRLGFGLRWAQMGLFETYRIAGGTAGMKHFLAQFGPCLKSPWTRLMDVPEYNDELVELIASQSDQQSGKYSIRELETIRDQNLVGFMRHLKTQEWGAGNVIAAFEAKTINTIAETEEKTSPPIETPLMLAVAPSWIDYNGHMTESRYLYCASMAADTLLALIGSDLAYVQSGFSYYTVESHIVHRDEAKLGQTLAVQGYIQYFDQKRIRLLFVITEKDRIVASVEQLWLHVDMNAGKSCAAPTHILHNIAQQQARQPNNMPQEFVGRAISNPEK